MTLKEMNVAIFEGKQIPHVLFQPRIEPWYEWHKQFNKLPARYKDKSLLELYDDLGLSMRYVHYYTGMPHPVRREYTKAVTIVDTPEGDSRTIVIDTPHGELAQRLKLTVDKTWWVVDFAVKTLRDLKKLRWLYENTTFTFDKEDFEKGSRFIGSRGEPQFYVPHSPYQSLCIEWMKVADFIYALNDVPEEVEGLMKAIDDSYDSLYEQIISYGKVRIVNFGENIDANLLSPKYFQQYLIPFYQKRSNQLREAGTYTHIHIDGSFKPLLTHLKSLPFDGLEALTPLPQGDVTLEEIKDHIADKVLLDGIPSILFLPHFPQEQLEECVEKLVDMFHPRLVLGVSDELPEGADEQSIERIKWVSDYCRRAIR